MNTTTSLQKPTPARSWPLGLFDEMHADLERVWDRALPMLPRALRGKGDGKSTWYPRLDIFEKNGDLVVKTDLPGMAKDDVQVTLDRGNLVLKGERKEESEVEEDDYYRCERSHGSFLRSLALPFETDAENVKASFEKGVLEVRVKVPEPAEETAAKEVAIS